MKAVTGVFNARSDAEHAIHELQAAGIAEKQIAVLTPDNGQQAIQAIPADAGEQPGMGKAIGAVLGASAGMAGGPLVVAAVVPGVGAVTALGLLGGLLLAAAGAGVGAVAGREIEDSLTQGLPEDELFVYEDALRRGRSVVVVMTHDEATASRVREVLSIEGAEAVDAAREQWWIGLRSAEQEHYSQPGRNFTRDEKFYRLGFESALHARMRCKEYDQVMNEMAAKIEDVQAQYPGENVAEAFQRGYERGRDYYEQLCNKSRAAA